MRRIKEKFCSFILSSFAADAIHPNGPEIHLFNRTTNSFI
jgi:hypothetical protein